MTSFFLGSYSDTAERTMALATVVAVHDDEVTVLLDGDAGAAPLACDPLHTSATPLALAAGDRVLCAPVRPDRGVVLGRVGPSHAPAVASAVASEVASDADAADVPDEIVIEARQHLTLKCGDGSITLRADGTVQIKGKDLVSHAQRLNRIKGGAVSIN